MVTWTNQDITCEALGIKGFEAYQSNDYRLAALLPRASRQDGDSSGGGGKGAAGAGGDGKGGNGPPGYLGKSAAAAGARQRQWW
jgi:hypothetical protein